jgi:hypothetical protein
MDGETFQKPDLSKVRLAPAFAIDLARAHVDGEFRRTQADLLAEHRRQEQRHLAALKASFVYNRSRDREAASNRYNTRMHIIDERAERMALTLRDEHNSMRGRLQALTKAGRSQQEWQREALRVRAGNLRVKVIDRFLDRKVELRERREADRKEIIREMRDMRQQHRDERLHRALLHDLNRDDRIQAYAQQIREQRAEQARQQQLERTKGEERQRTRAH